MFSLRRRTRSLKYFTWISNRCYMTYTETMMAWPHPIPHRTLIIGKWFSEGGNYFSHLVMYKLASISTLLPRLFPILPWFVHDNYYFVVTNMILVKMRAEILFAFPLLIEGAQLKIHIIRIGLQTYICIHTYNYVAIICLVSGAQLIPNHSEDSRYQDSVLSLATLTLFREE